MWTGVSPWIEATVSATGSQTFFGKTADLVQGVDELGHFEKVLNEIMILLVAAGVTICGIVFVYLLTIGVDFWEVRPVTNFEISSTRPSTHRK